MNEVLRQEKKFLISLEQYYRYSHHLAAVLHMDAHSCGEGYLIRSLYFDTLDDKDFEDKEDGVELRRKIRLRNYGADNDFAVLEMKQKQGAMQKKRSLRLNRDEARRLTRGDYSPLLAHKEPFAAECFGLMHCRCYRPKAVVEYRRTAYVARENNIRVTFDGQIAATESNCGLFDEHLALYPVMPGSRLVLEVKYNGFMLSYIKDALNAVERSELSVSKYCLARSVTLGAEG